MLSKRNSVSRATENIQNEAFCNKSWQLLPDNYCCKILHLRCLKKTCNISHKLLRPSQFLQISVNFWKFWNGSLCRNKLGPSPLLIVAAYWRSRNTESCAKKLSQILANNTDNGGGGLVSEFMWDIVDTAL